MEKNILPQHIQIKLEAFEGPFDLLFHLIEKNRVSLYDIPIAELTDQYVSIIKDYPGDMDYISGFIIMAATLLEIKSRMLLPKPQIDSPEEDPRELLVERLLEYRRYKQAADTLRVYESEGMKRVFRGPDTEAFRRLNVKKTINAAELLDGISLTQIYDTYFETLLRRELRTDKVRAGFSAVFRDFYTVDEKIDYLRAMLAQTPQMGFLGLLHICRSKSEKITTFLAMLELIKSKSVRFNQIDNFEDILLERVD